MKLNYKITLKRVIRTLRITLLVLSGLLISSKGIGQAYYFDNYSVIEGLAQSKVYSIVQDDKGYVWLGTKSGLSRFDGVSFINFLPDDGVAERAVRTIFKDKKGHLWFGHNAGSITFYDGKKFFVHPLSDSIEADITSIVQDNSGDLWISTHGDGIYRIKNGSLLDTSNLKVSHFKGKEIGDRVFGSYLTKGGELFFITDAMIKEFDPEKQAFKQFHPEGLGSFFQITTMLKDSRGDYWFGTYHGGLYRLKSKSDSMIIYDSKRHGLANNWISTIAEDSQGNVWVGTWGGGISMFSGDEMITFNSSNGLSDEKIHTIVEDVEGNILIGTNEHGLLIFKGGKFLTYDEKAGLGDNHVWAIHKDKKGRFWFGTNKGITVYKEKNGKETEPVYYNQKSDMIGDQIRYIKEDQDGNLWIGTNEHKVLQYLTEEGQFFYNPALNNYIRQMKFNNLEVDSDNNLWIGTMLGVLHYNIDNQEIARISQVDGLPGNYVTSVFSDKQGRVWVGVQYMGVTLIDGEKFVHVKGGRDITPTSIIKDNTGKLWIGTNSKGVYSYENDSLVKKYSKETGLLSDHITLLNVDKQNNLYIGTNRGLNKVTPDKGNIFTYTKKSGFTGIETKENASYLDDQGDLWFGTVKGAIKYRPDVHQKLLDEPITHIESMLVNLAPNEMTANQKLNYTDNSIVFNYKSICLSNPDAVQYQIKMEGADKEWRNVMDQTMANYSSLAPGSYTFLVKARNQAGVWNSEPAQYSFIIKPPFYKTWWFIIGVVILGVVGIIVFIQIRERNLRKEKQVLEQKVAERTKEISLKNEELRKKNNDIMDSIRYAERIQLAVLPPGIPFKNTFVLFKPKDIVSGDFYWMEQVDGKELMAAVDCTGHGVPGAFISILGHNLLTKIVREYGILETDQILDKLNSEVLNALHQSDVGGEKVVNDGMDLALISYDTKQNILEYCGAYNSLYFIRNGELEEYKANRFPIGRTTSLENKKFKSHKIEIQKGDTIYICSDGYADQFGGPMGKKFKSRPLKEYLVSIQHLSMDDQKKALEENLNQWQGSYDQVDDIVFIGKRF